MPIRLSIAFAPAANEVAGIAAFRQHAKVDVADDAGAVVLAEEPSGDAVLQLLFTDGGLIAHVGIIAFIPWTEMSKCFMDIIFLNRICDFVPQLIEQCH